MASTGRMRNPTLALPRTGSSLPRTMPLCRSTSGTCMRMICTMAASPRLPPLGLSVLRVMLTARWTGCGKKRKAEIKQWILLASSFTCLGDVLISVSWAVWISCREFSWHRRSMDQSC